MSEELQTLVIYDIPDDRIRYTVSEACLDYGLERIQYSCFRGRLSRNRREELFLRLKSLVGREAGKIRVQPVCDKDWRLADLVENAGKGIVGGRSDGKSAGEKSTDLKQALRESIVWERPGED